MCYIVRKIQKHFYSNSKTTWTKIKKVSQFTAIFFSQTAFQNYFLEKLPNGFHIGNLSQWYLTGIIKLYVKSEPNFSVQIKNLDLLNAKWKQLQVSTYYKLSCSSKTSFFKTFYPNNRCSRIIFTCQSSKCKIQNIL